MLMRSTSDDRPGAAEAAPERFVNPQRVASLRELSQGSGPLSATDLTTLRALLAQQRVPVWRPSPVCMVLGAAIWALALVGLWSMLTG